MKAIGKAELFELFAQAQLSPRKRAHLLLHESHTEPVQRLLIGMVKGSFVEPHFHSGQRQWEMFVVLQGKVEIKLFDGEGRMITNFCAGPQEYVSTVELQPNEIHSVLCLTEQALLLEIKEGPFDPNNAKCFPKFRNLSASAG